PSRQRSHDDAGEKQSRHRRSDGGLVGRDGEMIYPARSMGANRRALFYRGSAFLASSRKLASTMSSGLGKGFFSMPSSAIRLKTVCTPLRLTSPLRGQICVCV